LVLVLVGVSIKQQASGLDVSSGRIRFKKTTVWDARLEVLIFSGTVIAVDAKSLAEVAQIICLDY